MMKAKIIILDHDFSIRCAATRDQIADLRWSGNNATTSEDAPSPQRLIKLGAFKPSDRCG